MRFRLLLHLGILFTRQASSSTSAPQDPYSDSYTNAPQDPYNNPYYSAQNSQPSDWQPAISLLDLSGGMTNGMLNRGGFSDGTYGYLVPYGDETEQEDFHGTVTRFRLDSFANEEQLNLQNVANSMAGFAGGFASSTHGYLIPLKNTDGRHGHVVRFKLNTVPFSDAWQNEVDVLDLTNVHTDLVGFSGGFTDGVQYGYLIPETCGVSQGCKVVRFSFESFLAIDVRVLDLSPGIISTGSLSLAGGFIDGGYGYVVPDGGDDCPQLRGTVMRIDLSASFAQAMTTATTATVATLNLTATNKDLHGFCGSFKAGMWGYLVPTVGSKLARFNLQNFADVEFIDLDGWSPFCGGFADGTGTYGYMMSRLDPAGTVARINLQTFDANAIEAASLSSLHPHLMGFLGTFTDGTFGYAVNHLTSMVARFELTHVSTTDTTTSTVTRSTSKLTTRTTTTESTMGTTSTTRITTSTTSQTSITITVTATSSFTTSVMSTTTTTSLTTSVTSSATTTSLTTSVSSTIIATTATNTTTIATTAITSQTTASPTSVGGTTTTLTTEAERTSTTHSVTSTRTQTATRATTSTTANNQPSTIDGETTNGTTPLSATRPTTTESLATTQGETTASTRTRFPSGSLLTSPPPMADPIDTTTIATTTAPLPSSSIVSSPSSSSVAPSTPATSRTTRATLTTEIVTSAHSNTMVTSATTSTSSNTKTEPQVKDDFKEQVADLLFDVEEVQNEQLAELAKGNKSRVVKSSPGAVATASRLGSCSTGEAKINMLYQTDPPPNSASAHRIAAPSVHEVPIPEAKMVVGLPDSVFRDLVPVCSPGDEVVLTVTKVDVRENADLAWNTSGTSLVQRKGETAEVIAAAVIDLAMLRSRQTLNITNLRDGIEFSLPAAFNDNMACAFWDEVDQRWSTDGVEVSSKSTVGGDIVCLTHHLSFFAAIQRGFIETFLCSHFRLLTWERIGQIAIGKWYLHPGSIYWWCVLAISAYLFGQAARLDRQRRLTNTWNDEFFLIPTNVTTGPGVPELQREGVEAVPGEPETRVAWIVFCGQIALASISECAKEAPKDALDEILGQYSDYFADLRKTLEGLCDSLWVTPQPGVMKNVSRSAMTQSVMSTSRKMASATMGISPEMVDFVLDDKDFLKVLMTWRDRNPRRHSERRISDRRDSAVSTGSQTPRTSTILFLSEGRDSVISRSLSVASFASDMVPMSRQGSRRSVQSGGSALTRGTSDTMGTVESRGSWKVCSNNLDSWAQLHEEVIQHMDVHLGNQLRWYTIPKMVCRLFACSSSFGSMFTYSIFMNCKMRVFFFLLEMNGALLLTCFFFSATGTIKGKHTLSQPSTCATMSDSTELGYMTGRVIAIGIGSVFLALIPVSFLQSLQTRGFRKFPHEGCPEWKKQLRTWKTQDKLIYILGSLYLAFGSGFVTVYLANFDQKDHTEFLKANVISIIQETIVTPLAIAVFAPLMAGAFLKFNMLIAGGDIHASLRHVQEHFYKSTNAMPPVASV